MTSDKITPEDTASISVAFGGSHVEKIGLRGRFDVWCVGPDGKEKWREVIDNIVTTVGKNDLLDKYLKGSAYTQTVVMGLKGTGTAVAGDTQASHAAWLEEGLANAPTYTGSRKALVFNAASGGSSVTPVQAFAITSSGTVFGCFINNGGSATIDNTTGVLFSAGDFSGGSKIVALLDTVNVTYTLSV